MRALFVTDDYLIDPLGIMYLSSYLKRAGHEVDIVKAKNGLGSLDQPDMVCYSVTTGKHGYYRDLNLELREQWKSTVSVFGGPHVTFFPEFAQQGGVDIGVRGEGFDAIVDIADAIQNHALDFHDIPNTVVGDNLAPLRPVKDKANLLHPDRELIYSYPENFNNPIKNVMCSFFCFYSCPYCYSKRYRELYGLRKAQVRSVDDVLAEVDELRAYPLELIFFQDDIFPVYDQAWLESFCEGYSEVGIPFHIQVRAEMLNEAIIRKLKAVGLHGVTFAIESGNDVLRRDVLGRKMLKETITGAAAWLRFYGIKLRTENMVGIPGESWQTAMQTLDLNIGCRPTLAWASLYQPYPGTDLGDQCVKDGSFDGDLDEISGDFFTTYRLRVNNARRYERLQKLFSIIVAKPFLRPFAGILCRLPLNRFYGALYRWFKKRKYIRELYKVGD
jgi:anaerobic magnesium-protoporphyrin IX monomethyl ester cyclase